MSKLKFKKLSEYKENEAKCYFTEAKLIDYLVNLNEKYDDYDIQRGIINNFFLEDLAKTLKEGEFIPSIILVLNNNSDSNGEELIVEKGDFNILDGLQRTVRLKKLLEATKFINKYESEIKEFKSNFQIRKFFRENNKNVYQTDADYVIKALENVLELKHFDRLQWFEVWENLGKEEQIKKMIIFNAGHKSMDIKHQLELIFLNSIDLEKYKKCSNLEFTKTNKCDKQEICIIHSKEILARSFYSKKRRGAIHFTLLIDAIIAMENKKPFTIDQKSIVNFQKKYEEYKIIQKIVSLYIQQLISFFSSLDEIFCNEYKEKGLEFLGRESVIIGLFAAIGNIINIENFEKDLEDIKNKIQENIDCYNIDSFEKMKKKVDVTAFNIGEIMKETVYYLTLHILKGKKISFEEFPVNNAIKYRKFIEELRNDYK